MRQQTQVCFKETISETDKVWVWSGVFWPLLQTTAPGEWTGELLRVHSTLTVSFLAHKQEIKEKHLCCLVHLQVFLTLFKRLPHSFTLPSSSPDINKPVAPTWKVESLCFCFNVTVYNNNTWFLTSYRRLTIPTVPAQKNTNLIILSLPKNRNYTH